MRRLLVAARSQPEVWAGMFRAALPEHEILTSPPADDEPVAYAVVGKPEPGLLGRLQGLEVVLSLNAGVEHLLAGGEVPAGAPIVRLVDEGLIEGMVSWVMAQVLVWHRSLHAYRLIQTEGRWAPMRETMARERTVTVLGVGALGGAVARMLVAFGFNTRVWSRTGRDVPDAAVFTGPEEFAAALDGADILIDLLPLTPATENLLDAEAFARLARGALFINGGRGGHVVDRDLIDALDSGLLSGAALDVFREEPLPAGHPFWSHPKIRVSPHVAAPTLPQTAVAAMAETVRRHERGEPLLNAVDRARGY